MLVTVNVSYLPSRRLLIPNHKQSLHTFSLSLKNMGSLANLLQTTVPRMHLPTFQEFTHSYGFTHVTSCLLYLQSNDLIERKVQTVKDPPQKWKEYAQDSHMAMLRLRSTYIRHDLPSPAELLNGQQYHTNLPPVSKLSSL